MSDSGVPPKRPTPSPRQLGARYLLTWLQAALDDPNVRDGRVELAKMADTRISEEKMQAAADWSRKLARHLIAQCERIIAGRPRPLDGDIKSRAGHNISLSPGCDEDTD